MRKKIILGSIFAALVLLSMPVISNIQAQPKHTIEGEKCRICPFSKITKNMPVGGGFWFPGCLVLLSLLLGLPLLFFCMSTYGDGTPECEACIDAISNTIFWFCFGD